MKRTLFTILALCGGGFAQTLPNVGTRIQDSLARYGADTAADSTWTFKFAKIKDGSRITADTIDCTVACHFNDTTLSVQDSLLAGFDAVFGIVDVDSIQAGALRVSGKANVGATTDPAFDFGVGGSVVITNTNTAGYVILTLGQSATGGLTPAGILRYGSTYATTALRNKLEVFGTGGIRFTVGGGLNKEANIDTFAVYRGPGAVLDSLTVTGKIRGDSATFTDDVIVDSNLAATTLTVQDAEIGNELNSLGNSNLGQYGVDQFSLQVTLDSVVASKPFKADSINTRALRVTAKANLFDADVGRDLIAHRDVYLGDQGSGDYTFRVDSATNNALLRDDSVATVSMLKTTRDVTFDSINTRALVVNGVTKSKTYADSTYVWEGCGGGCSDTITITTAGPGTIVDFGSASGVDTLVILGGNPASMPKGFKVSVTSFASCGFEGTCVNEVPKFRSNATNIRMLGSNSGGDNVVQDVYVPSVLGYGTLGTDDGVYAMCATTLTATAANWVMTSTTGCSNYNSP